MRAESAGERLKYEDFGYAGTAVEDDRAAIGWVTDQAAFNYKLPCPREQITAVAIIVKDLNAIEHVEKNEYGDYLSVNDTSAVFPEFERFCVAMVMPKSGLSAAAYNENNNTYNRYYRSYWVSEGDELYNGWSSTDLYLRKRSEELAAYMDIIYAANTSLHKPVIIFNGNVNKYVTLNLLKTLGGEGRSGIAPFIEKVTAHTQKDILSAIVGQGANYSAVEGWIDGETFSISGWKSKDADPAITVTIGAR
jgi:hypothetical protein